VSSFRALIIDDEPLARDSIRALLTDDGDVEIVGEGTGTDGAALIARMRPDILFLDLQMPEVDGFALMEQVGADAVPAVVFVTAYDRYALRAFEVHAIDYLLKPFDDARFHAALENAKTRVRNARRGDVESRIADLLRERNAGARTRFLIPTRDKSIVVESGQIDWIEAADCYVSIHIGAAAHLLRLTMEELEAQLDPQQFFRVHRSTIVNLDRVREVHPLFRGDSVLVLAGGERVRLSRNRKREFEARFTQPKR
jgi:two-component system, LytTR family, response regulator